MNLLLRDKLPVILQEFFWDVNVKFPQAPKLVEGIRVYVAPNGLGIQFRGSSERVAIKGKRSIVLWEWLSRLLNGEYTLDDIFHYAMEESSISVSEIGSMLKTLHCYHIICERESLIQSSLKISNSNENSTKQQKYFFQRVFPFMGGNRDIAEVDVKLQKSSVLLITNKELLEAILLNLRYSGIGSWGIVILASKSEVLDFIGPQNLSFIEEHPIKYLTSFNKNEIRYLLDNEIPNYKYVLPIINNPNPFFSAEIARSCFGINRPMLSVSFFENTYEIGPFFIPCGDSSCCACRHLRKQSFNDSSVHDFLYYQHLNECKLLFDSQISGYNLQGANIAINLALSQIIMSITQVAQPSLINRVLSYDALKLSVSVEDVIKVPGCPYCS